MILFTTQLTFVSTENTSLLFINFLFNFKLDFQENLVKNIFKDRFL